MANIEASKNGSTYTYDFCPIRIGESYEVSRQFLLELRDLYPKTRATITWPGGDRVELAVHFASDLSEHMLAAADQAAQSLIARLFRLDQTPSAMSER